MHLIWIILVAITLLTIADAFVEFEKSRLYDETDFDGVQTVYVPLYCSSGCLIYASIPAASIEVARNILIFDFDSTNMTSLLEADAKDAEGRKLPFVVDQANPQVNFINTNGGLKSAPLAVWIVKGDAPHIDSAEVYDADGLYHPLSSSGLITIMNTESFAVTTETNGPMTMEAIAAGFDAFGSADNCTRILQQTDRSTYQDVLVTVNSPLITFFFDVENNPDTAVLTRASNDTNTMFDLTKRTFVTSPGYIGCSVLEGPPINSGGEHTKTFRSSLYEATTEYNYTSNDTVSIELSSDLNTDQNHAVYIVSDGEMLIELAGTKAGPSIKVNAKNLTITWAANFLDFDQYFMIRLEPVCESKNPSPDPSFIPISTTIPTPRPDTKSTTPFEPEPVSTTEVDVKTKSTTMEDEAYKTTTMKPEPVPFYATTYQDGINKSGTTTEGIDIEPSTTFAYDREQMDSTQVDPDTSSTSSSKVDDTTIPGSQTAETIVSSTTVPPTTSVSERVSILASIPLMVLILLR